MRKYLVIAVAVVCLAMWCPATRAQTQESGINGKWHFVLETPGGERDVDADFTVDQDGNVAGKWADADVAGTYKEGKLALSFQFTSEEAGTTADMKIDGKLDENAALAGDWAFSEYNGTFKAIRPSTGIAPAPAPASQETAPSQPSNPHGR